MLIPARDLRQGGVAGGIALLRRELSQTGSANRPVRLNQLFPRFQSLRLFQRYATTGRAALGRPRAE